MRSSRGACTCLVTVLILSRFIEKARQDQQSLYSLPAWDKDPGQEPTVDEEDKRPKVW